jgi:phosphoribosylanthranilate isomerase
MIVQIYTMQTPDEARAVVACGVDHIGVTPSNRGLPGEVDVAAARAICEAVGGAAVTVAISVESDLDAIVAMVQAVRPDMLHLCGLPGAVPPDAVRALRARLPGARLMQAISVAGPEAIQAARAYEDVADCLILDTQAPNIGGIGASGATHDWTISRAIVQQTRLPVILAGGLSPENVADAIRAVRPWGVDSLTHTNHPLPDGGFRKDFARVRQFVEAARGA